MKRSAASDLRRLPGWDRTQDLRHRDCAKQVTVSDGHGGRLEVSYLLAQEQGAPESVKPVECWLLGNRPIATFESAVELWSTGTGRLGDRILLPYPQERLALQLSMVERLELALALFMVVAWRISRLMRLVRTCPDLDAALLF